MAAVSTSAVQPERPMKAAARSATRLPSFNLPIDEQAKALLHSETGGSELSSPSMEAICTISTESLAGRRSTMTSGIPMFEKREKRVAKQDNTIDVPIRMGMIPTAETLEVMMERGRDGDSTYSSLNSYSKPAEPINALIRQITPLHIRRKQPLSADSFSRDGDNAVAMRIKHTFDHAIAQQTTPPATPPALSRSVYSDGDSDSFRSSNKSSWQSGQPHQGISRTLYFDEHSSKPLPNLVPKIVMHEVDGDEGVTAKGVDMDAIVDQSLDSFVPDACPLIAEPDLPGILPQAMKRSGSQSSSASDIDDEDDDGDSIHRFGLEAFPVPSIVLATPSVYNPPASQPRSPRVTPPSMEAEFPQSPTTTQSTPRPDLFRTPTPQPAAADWDLAEELEIRDRVFRAEMKAPSQADKVRRKELRRNFDPKREPSRKDMYEASLLSVRDEYGNRIRFGSLFEGQRTIVCFIRHFWCSQCQDYVDDIAKVKPAVLEKYGLRLVIISNGSWKMIRPYRKVLGDRCPYPIYTDRAKHVYTAMGMTLRTWNAGKDSEKGKYIKHSLGQSVVAGIANGLAMPLKPPGDQQQLGGEFVLGPGLQVKFTHRMKSTRNHAEIEDVLAAVGVNLNTELEILAPTPVIPTPDLAWSRESQDGNDARSGRPLSTATINTYSSLHPSSAANTPRLPSMTSRRVKDLGISSASIASAPSSQYFSSPTPSQSTTFSRLRRSSQAPRLFTPSPATPMSMTFPGSPNTGRVRPPVGEDSTGRLSPHPQSSDIEASSSRFSSSSEEEERKRGVKGLFGHKKLSKRSSHPSINSKH